MFTDVVSAAVLQGLPGLELDPSGWSTDVVNAGDRVEAGGSRRPYARLDALLSIEGREGCQRLGPGTGAGGAGRRTHQGGGRSPRAHRARFVNEEIDGGVRHPRGVDGRRSLLELGPDHLPPGSVPRKRKPQAGLDGLLDRSSDCARA